jgi:hypothetical protein
VIGVKAVNELVEQFEKSSKRKEHRLFGEEGLEKTVEDVAAMEKQLSIYDLAEFTPK